MREQLTTSQRVALHRAAATDPRTITVRLTQYGAVDATLAEIEEVVGRKGLVYRPERGAWLASQAELDTPHATFRLSPL
jgi:hypothetical protein